MKKFKCPKCNKKQFQAWKSSVYQRQDDSITRKRKCKNCGYEIKTVEVMEDTYIADKELVKELKKLILKYVNTKK